MMNFVSFEDGPWRPKKLALATERKRNRNRCLSSFGSFKEICCNNQFTTAQPGPVATWCKPSSGANVVRMAMLLRGWVQLPAMKNRDRLSNFTRALDQPEQHRTDESLDTMVWSVRAPPLPKIFLAIFHLWNSCDNVCALHMCLFCLWCVYYHL